MMDILIKAGADFNAVDEEGKTVLIEAAKNGILKNENFKCNCIYIEVLFHY